MEIYYQIYLVLLAFLVTSRYRRARREWNEPLTISYSGAFGILPFAHKDEPVDEPIIHQTDLKNFNDRRALTQLLGRDARLDDPAGLHKSEVFRYRGSRDIYIT